MLIMSGESQNGIVSITKYQLLFKIDRAIRQIFNRVIKKHTNPEYCFFQQQRNSFVRETDDIRRYFPFKPDVIVAHWVSNFVTIEMLYKLSKEDGIPIVWYLLDMAPLTGGCHYAWNCKGYTSRCGNCPALYSHQEKDLSFNSLMEKKKFIREMNITFVAGSFWLENQSRNAVITEGKRIEKILLAVDPEIFKPSSKVNARNVFGLPIDKKIVFFAANSWEESRKGIKYVLELINLFSEKYPSEFESCLFVGAGRDDDRNTFDGTQNFYHLGYLGNDQLLATAYQAADLFLSPSVEDSGPMMINEALMVGTPVVSFRMGVAPDLVYEGKTGYIAELGDVEGLMAGMRKILNLGEQEKAALKNNCIKKAMELCHPQVQARSFEKLFKSILDGE